MEEALTELFTRSCNKNKDEMFKTEVPLSMHQALSSCDIQNICRICLTTNNQMLHSVSFHDVEKYVLRDMFIELTSLQVSDEDGLPNNICNSCREEVVHCYNFKIKCLDSDHILKTVFTSTFDYTDDTQTSNDLSTNYDDIKTEEVTDTATNENNQNLRYENRKSRMNNKKKHKPSNGPKVNQHKCSYCLKSYDKVSSLQKHIERRHRTETTDEHKCDKCSNTYTCAEDLMLHQSLHNKGAWKCNKCGKEFNVRASLKRHLLRHMSTRAHSCETCGKTFVERCAMLRHQAVHTGQRPPKKLACQFCDKRFVDNRQLSAHVNAHTKSRPCACATCGKGFTSLRLLASHQRVHTDHKPYACNYCDKRFRHDSARNTHHRTHTGERPFVCSVCGRNFIQQSNLSMHMRSHTGERPYSCTTCGRKFSTGSALKSHIRTHTGEKPYSCQVCGKRFARKDTKAHMRLHTGERPYECAVCPKRFNNASHLREHNRLHTGERPFECALCTRKFSTKSHLIKHVRLHEKKKQKKGVLMYRPYKISKKNEPNKYVIIEESVRNNVDNYQEITAIEETPIVAQELTIPSEVDSDMSKTELIVLNNVQDIQEGYIQLSNDMNLVAVNEGDVNIASTIDGTTMKLYQFDQSLLQIHSTGGQLTISKITSKMTANF